MTLNIDNIVQEYFVKTDGAVKSVGDLEKMFRKQEKASKQVEYVLGQVAGKADGLAAAMDKQARSLLRAITPTIDLGQAVGKLGAALKAAAAFAIRYEDDVLGNVDAIMGMREASKGLISDFDLVKAKNRLASSEVRVTEERLQALSKAAVEFKRITAGEFAPSMDQLVNAVLAGGRGLKQLGIQADFTGTTIQRAEQVMDTLVKRFASSEITLQTTGEKIEAIKNSLERMAGAAGAWVLGANSYQEGLTGIADTADLVATAVEAATGALKDFTSEKTWKAVTTMMAMLPGGSKFIQPMIDAYKATLLINAQKEGFEAYPGLGDRDLPISVGPSKKKTKTKKGQLKTRGGGWWEWAGQALDEYQPDIAELVGAVPMEDRMRVLEEQESREAMSRAMMQDAEAWLKHNSAVSEYINILRAANEEMNQLAVGGLANWTAGLWAAADAAISGGESFDKALAKMTKSTLLNIAAEATVKAAMAMAEGIFALASIVRAPQAAGYFAAAGKFIAVAALAGGAGLALSAGMGDQSSGAASGQSGSSAASNAPSRGFASQSVQPQKTVINIYFGNKGDLGARIFAQKQTEMEIAKKAA